MIIDTHAHLYVEELKLEQEDIIQKAKENGIAAIVLPAIDNETHKDLLTLSQNHKGFAFAMMGVHPCSIKENWKEELQIAEELYNEQIVAIGEIGLDFYWDKTFAKEQITAFEMQIEWAIQKQLPINIHCRNAMQECINIVKHHQNGNLNGIFHCFSGSYESAKQILDLNFYLGIGGVVTYKNAGLAEVIAKFSCNNLVLETDAPYLTPVPYRGKPNMPYYITYVADKIATIYNISRTEVETITTKNALTIYKKLEIAK
jgi:TatD DNase family protein